MLSLSVPYFISSCLTFDISVGYSLTKETKQPFHPILTTQSEYAVHLLGQCDHV